MEFDAFFILLPVFALSVTILLGYEMLSVINASNQFCLMASTEVQAPCQQAFDNGLQILTWLDKAIILIYVASIIGAIISALQVESHPVFFIVTIFSCALIWVAVPLLSNTYFALVNNSTLNAAAWHLQGSISFWQNALFITTISALILGVATHGKPRAQGFAWNQG